MLIKNRSNLFVAILSLLFFCTPVMSGATVNCESIQSGEWRESSTWINCDNVYPNTADKAVLINAGHVINLNNSIIIHSLSMQVGSQLTGNSMIFNVFGSGFDSSDGNILYEGRLYVTNNGGNIILGAVSGTNDVDGVKLESNSDIILANAAGAINAQRVRAFSSLPTGKIIISNDINTSSSQWYYNQLELGRNVTLVSNTVEMNNGLNLNGFDLEIDVVTSDSKIQGTILGASSTLLKSGVGKLHIEAEKLSAGNTLVDEGRLYIENIYTDDIVVSSGAELHGDGQINGMVIMNDGSRVSPGANSGPNIGAITIESIDMGNDAELVITINGMSAGTSQDQLIVTNSVSLNAQLYVFGGFRFSSGEMLWLYQDQ